MLFRSQVEKILLSVCPSADGDKDIKVDTAPDSPADILKKQDPPVPPDIKEYLKTSVSSQDISKREVKFSSEEKKSGQAEEKKRSVFAETASEIIKKIWSWILVGEEYRPKGVTMEYAIASTWLLRLGIIAIVTCIGYFLNWSIQQGLISDAGRVGVSIIAGIVMLGIGWRILGGKYKLLGSGLMGGGVAALYFRDRKSVV